MNDVDDAVEAVRGVNELNRLLVRRTFERRFTAEAMAQAYLAIYGKLSRTRRGALTTSLTDWHDLPVGRQHNIFAPGGCGRRHPGHYPLRSTFSAAAAQKSP